MEHCSTKLGSFRLRGCTAARDHRTLAVKRTLCEAGGGLVQRLMVCVDGSERGIRTFNAIDEIALAARWRSLTSENTLEDEEKGAVRGARRRCTEL